MFQDFMLHIRSFRFRIMPRILKPFSFPALFALSHKTESMMVDVYLRPNRVDGIFLDI
jgi:hypothetical protein